MHLIILPPKVRDYCKSRAFKTHSVLHQDVRNAISEHQTWRKCWIKPMTTMMITILWRIRICISGRSKIKKKKFNTPFSSRVNLKEFGRNYIKLLIVQMCYCTSLMLETLMELEPSLSNTTSKTNAQTSILSSSSINAILSPHQSQINGSNIYPKLHPL